MREALSVRPNPAQAGFVRWARRLALLAALAFSVSACQSPAVQEPEIERETPEAPTEVSGLEFVARDLDGENVRLSSLRGKVVLVNFWASWCPPCREEMPLLQSYYEEHAGEDFVLLGMNVSDQPGSIEEIIQMYGLTFPIWRDPLGDIMTGLNINGLPTSILVNAAGEPLFVWLGPFDQASLDQHVTPLLTAP